MITQIGTPFYMAPEIYFQGTYDKSADIFGLGVTIFELMARCVPFTADNYIKLN